MANHWFWVPFAPAAFLGYQVIFSGNVEHQWLALSLKWWLACLLWAAACGLWRARVFRQSLPMIVAISPPVMALALFFVGPNFGGAQHTYPVPSFINKAGVLTFSLFFDVSALLFVAIGQNYAKTIRNPAVTKFSRALFLISVILVCSFVYFFSDPRELAENWIFWLAIWCLIGLISGLSFRLWEDQQAPSKLAV